jgi:hypothetical protein
MPKRTNPVHQQQPIEKSRVKATFHFSGDLVQDGLVKGKRPLFVCQ